MNDDKSMQHVALVTKQSWIDAKPTERPRTGVPGGGIVAKTQYIKEAVPEITLTSDYGTDKIVLLIEPLSFHENKQRGISNLEDNLESLESSKSLKILWIEEQEPLRWTGNLLNRVLKTVDAVAVSNKYLKQQLEPMIDQHKLDILYTPIPENRWATNNPMDRKNEVIAVGQISMRKNIPDIVSLFNELDGGETDTLFLGNAGLWGDVELAFDKKLEREVEEAATRWIPYASRNEISQIEARSKVYVNMSIYDVGCLSFLEAAMAGCVCLCWDYHPMFDEYVHCVRFDGVEDGAEMVEKMIVNDALWENKSMGIQNEVREKHGYRAFRENLRRVIDGALYG